MSLEEWEMTAAIYGGAMGAQYLESINKTDLATLSPEQWATFLECICKNYHAKHSELKPCPF